MKWAVVTSDGHGTHHIQGFATKKAAQEFIKAVHHPEVADAGWKRHLYRLVPA